MMIDLSTIDGYDLVCGLRGPDIHAPCVKWVFSARLRALIGMKRLKNEGCMIRETSGLGNSLAWIEYMPYSPDLEYFTKDCEIVDPHYFFHMQVAFLALPKVVSLRSEEMKEAEALTDLAGLCSCSKHKARDKWLETFQQGAWDTLFKEETSG